MYGAQEGNGSLKGSEGNDNLNGLWGEITILALGGADSISFTDSTGLVDAGAGNDVIVAKGSIATLNGGAGDDKITADKGRYSIDGGDGNDTVTTSYSSNLITAGLGDDTITVSYGDCAIYGGDGMDTIYVSYGNCLIESGAGNDYVQVTGGFSKIELGAGDDVVVSKSGSHTMSGGIGSDRLYGSDGDDVLIGGAGDDLLVGGNGTDIVSYETALAGMTVGINFGATFIIADGEGGTDQVQYVEGIRLTEFNDTLTVTGTTGVRIEGGKGDDRITGSTGNDVIIGGEGGDMLSGGGGNDVLIGGADRLATANEDRAYRIYVATLGREPDLQGLKYWAAQLDAGKTMKEICTGFVDSAEFQGRYGNLDVGNFVTLLYNNVLGRAPDQAGLASWTGAIWAGATRAEVVAGFAESAEFQLRTKYAATEFLANGGGTPESEGQVYRLYQATLGRTPDQQGFLHWVDNMAEGTSLKSVAEMFVGSAEFTQRYGTLNDEAFVDLMYQNVLGRAADAVGKDSWVTGLRFGAFSRTDVVLGFSDSSEFINNTKTGLADYEGTIANWHDTLTAGDGNCVMIGGRGADDYYFFANNKVKADIYGLTSADNLRFLGFGTAGINLKSYMAQVGNDVVFHGGNVDVTIHDFNLVDITADMLPFSR